MNSKLRLGFIGGGVNSAVGTTHFIASQMDGRFEVVAGCFSRHAEVNTETGSCWGISEDRLYNNSSEMLMRERDDIDAIVILTPTPEHVEPVLEALKNRYPVICEKALATSSTDVLLIEQTQTQQQGFLAVTYNYTGYPMLRELRHMIHRGDLGKVEQIHVEMPQEGYARLNRQGESIIPQQWRLHDGELPTLSLDLGVHLHHIIDFLTGEKPQEVVASQSTHGRFVQVIDTTMCIARYTNALECSIWYSKAALGYRNGLRIRVFGEHASAEWYQMEPENLMYYDSRGRKTIIDRANVDVDLAPKLRYNRFKAGHPAGFLEAFANHYWDIADSLVKFNVKGFQAESEYVFTARHALEGLLMLEAISQSSKEHCWKVVNLPDYQ